jgi:hypothetical protein
VESDSDAAQAANSLLLETLATCTSRNVHFVLKYNHTPTLQTIATGFFGEPANSDNNATAN